MSERCAYILLYQPDYWLAGDPIAKCGAPAEVKFGSRWYCATHDELLRRSEVIAAIQERLSEE